MAALAKRAKAERVMIDRARSCPGHGKFFLRGVDGAHAVIKTEARKVMAYEEDGAASDDEDCKPRLEQAKVDGTEGSLAEELHRHLSETLTFGRVGAAASRASLVLMMRRVAGLTRVRLSRRCTDLPLALDTCP